MNRRPRTGATQFGALMRNAHHPQRDTGSGATVTSTGGGGGGEKQFGLIEVSQAPCRPTRVCVVKPEIALCFDAEKLCAPRAEQIGIFNQLLSRRIHPLYTSALAVSANGIFIMTKNEIKCICARGQ
jgi:hypothetical protein